MYIMIRELVNSCGPSKTKITITFPFVHGSSQSKDNRPNTAKYHGCFKQVWLPQLQFSHGMYLGVIMYDLL